MATNLQAAYRPSNRVGQDGGGSGVATAYNGDGAVDASVSGVFRGDYGLGHQQGDSERRDRDAAAEQLRFARLGPIPRPVPVRAFFSPESNVRHYTDGASLYHPEEMAALLRRRAGVSPRLGGAVSERRERVRASFGGTSQTINPGDAPGMPHGGHSFQFETNGYTFGSMMIDGVPVGPANGSDEDLGDMNEQINRAWTQARTQGVGQLRHFLNTARAGSRSIPVRV